jgi:hypothetical protein
VTRQVLKDVLALLERQHHQPREKWLIAVDEHGDRARPLSPAAVAFTLTGAIAKVAPGQSMTDETIYADFSAPGEAAHELLKDTREALYATAENFPHMDLAAVDFAGAAAALRLVRAALNDYEPEPRRHLHAVGTGSNPKGAQ